LHRRRWQVDANVDANETLNRNTSRQRRIKLAADKRVSCADRASPGLLAVADAACLRLWPAPAPAARAASRPACVPAPRLPPRPPPRAAFATADL